MSRYLVLAVEDKFSASHLVKKDISYRELFNSELFNLDNYVKEFENYADALKKAKSLYEKNWRYQISDESFNKGYARVAVLEIDDNKLVSVVALGSDDAEKRYNSNGYIVEQIQNYIRKSRSLSNDLSSYEIKSPRQLIEQYLRPSQEISNMIEPFPTYTRLHEVFDKIMNHSHQKKEDNIIDLTIEDKIVDVVDKEPSKYKNNRHLEIGEKKKEYKNENQPHSKHKAKPRMTVEEKALQKALISDISIGLRTIGMQERYEDLPNIVKSSKNESYVVLSSQVNMVELVKQGAKSVTIGSSDREIVMIDPNSAVLQNFYKELVDDAHIENIDGSNYKTLFDAMNAQIRASFGDTQQKSHAQRKEDIKKMRHNWKGPTIELKAGNRPLIATEKVLDRQSGVCRHHAIYTTYVLAKMIEDGMLNDGEVFLCRDQISSGGAHQWVVYRSNDTKEVWLIDSYWNVTLNLSDPKDYKRATEMKYGEAAIERLMDRFEKPASSKLTLML